MSARRLGIAALVLAAVAAGALSVAIARDEPGYSLSGRSLLWNAVGSRARARRDGGRVRGTWSIRTPRGCCRGRLAPPAMEQPGRRLGRRLHGRAAVPGLPAARRARGARLPGGRVAAGSSARARAAYAGTLAALGLLPRARLRPRRAGCGECPGNLLARDERPGRVQASTAPASGWCSAWSGRRSWRRSRSRGRALLARRAAVTAPVLLPRPPPTSALVAADYAHCVARGFLSNDAARPRPLARAGGRARPAAARRRAWEP